MRQSYVTQAYFERHFVSNNNQNGTEMMIRATSKNCAKLNLLSTRTNEFYIGSKTMVNATLEEP